MHLDKNKKIYVAGHTGLVGSSIIRRLKEDNHLNIVTKTHAELDLVRQSDVYDFLKQEKPDYIFLAAGRVGGIGANNIFKGEFIYQNLMIQTNVIHAAHLADVQKLCFFSSASIYPKSAEQPMKEDYLFTGKFEESNKPYSIAKIAGTALCDSYNSQYGREYISIIPANLYGPNDNYNANDGHVIASLLKRMHEAKVESRSELTIWGSGSATRDFLFVDDLVNACLLLIDNGYNGQMINVGSGSSVSIRELAFLIKKVVGFEGDLIFDLSKPEGMPKKLLDSSKINSMGWLPKVSLWDGLQVTYNKDFI